MNSWAGLAWTCAAFVVAGYFLDDIFPLDETTVYLGWCPADRVNGVCPRGEQAGFPTHYKVLVDQQIVMYWVEKNPPTKYEGCVVRNVRNWACTERFADKSSMTSSMSAGIAETTSYPPSVFGTSPYYQVPKWRWMILNWNTKTVR